MVVAGETVEVAGTVEDESEVSVRVGGTDAEVADGVFRATVSLAAGEQKLAIIAEDASGNRSEAAVTVISDRMAPVIEISEPAEGALVSASFDVVGTVADDTKTRVQVGGRSADVIDGAWSITLSLPNGRQAIEIEAIDAAGNRAGTVITVESDTVPPEIHLKTPTHILALEGSATIAGVVSGCSELSCAGQVVVVDNDGAFSVTLEPDDTLGSFDLIAVDAARNESSAEVHIAKPRGLTKGPVRDGVQTFVRNGIEFVIIPGGDCEIVAASGDEAQHRSQKVFVRPFLVSRCEITRRQYREQMGGDVLVEGAESFPATDISWIEASEYCKSIDARLPTDAQWQAAALLGESKVDATRANLLGSADGHEGASPVATYSSNRLGVCDALGNAAEWCADRYSSQGNGDLYVVRGGSFELSERHALRPRPRMAWARHKSAAIGFRAVIVAFE